jgi:putative addiction module component (TIGR02574 family)
MKTEDLIEEIRSLPVEERAHLADVILKSLNQPASDMDQKWGELAVQRLSDLKTGLVQAIPGEEVFEEIWKRYP